MQVEVKINFNSVEEAANFLNAREFKPSTTVSTSAAATEELTPAEKAKRTKAANKAKKAAEKKAKEEEAKAAAAIQAQQPVKLDPSQTAAAVMQAPVQAAPVQAAPVQAASTVDRDALIAKASGLVGAMKNLGVEDTEVLPQLQNIFAANGVAFCKVSQCSDADLPKIVNAMEVFVQGLQNANQSYV